jgi:hypothetical protein
MASTSSSSSTEKRLERTYVKLLPAHVTTATEAYDAWLQYAWIGGADLPLAKAPIILERGACGYLIGLDANHLLSVLFN